MRSAALAVLPLLVAACSGSKPNAAGPPVTVQRAEVRADVGAVPGASQAAQTGQVVAQLQFRDHVLVIRTGTGELRFDVQTRAGLLVAGSLTRQELDARFPAIADHFRDSTAIQIDASLDRSAGRESPLQP